MPNINVKLTSKGSVSNKFDIEDTNSLKSVIEGSDVVINTVGLLQASPRTFERVQFQGALNAAKVSNEFNAKFIHISAIGADKHSKLPYPRTKGIVMYYKQIHLINSIFYSSRRRSGL